MRKLARSEGIGALLVLLAALMVVQCGDDDGCTDCGGGGEPAEPECTNEELTAGLYSFTPVRQEDDCEEMFALFRTFGLIPDGPFPFQLPSYGALPQQVTITLPLPGSPQVPGTLSEEFGEIVFTAPGSTQIFIDLPPLPPEFEDFPDTVSFQVTIGGTLCPISEERVDALLTVTVPQAVPFFTTSGCSVEATLRGAR